MCKLRWWEAPKKEIKFLLPLTRERERERKGRERERAISISDVKWSRQIKINQIWRKVDVVFLSVSVLRNGLCAAKFCAYSLKLIKASFRTLAYPIPERHTYTRIQRRERVRIPGHFKLAILVDLGERLRVSVIHRCSIGIWIWKFHAFWPNFLIWRKAVWSRSRSRNLKCAPSVLVVDFLLPKMSCEFGSRPEQTLLVVRETLPVTTAFTKCCETTLFQLWKRKRDESPFEATSESKITYAIYTTFTVQYATNTVIYCI